MSTIPKKRRKMRPNNSITVEREDKIKKRSISQNEKKAKSQKKFISTAPEPKVYSSASDSDETDNEGHPARIKPTSSVQSSLKPKSKPKEIDSIHRPKTVKPTQPKPTPAKPTTPKEADLSSSDSSSESEEETRFRTSKFIEDSDLERSASDSDETDKELTMPNQNMTETSDQTEKKSQLKFRDSFKSTGHLTSNRISFRKKGAYDPEKPAKVNLKLRLNDTFVPQVYSDRFISDSCSSDSDVDYDEVDYPPWHSTLAFNTKKDKEPWPKTRKLGYSDKLKLEKRIKKICQRDSISFEEAQDIFSSHKRGQLRFFQKIGRVFPDIPLYRLAKLCKEIYHKNRNSDPWTPEEIQQLDALVKIHGNSAETISKYMNRSPKNINDFIFSHKKASKKASVPWSTKEDEILAKSVAEARKINPDRPSLVQIEKLLKGKRTLRQIHARYHAIGHRIQPDGTILPNRKATTEEHIEYLKGLLNQVKEHNLIEESQLNFTKNRGFVRKSYYLIKRAQIPGFEKMKIKDILDTLIENESKKK